jgi:hypothetical protein
MPCAQCDRISITEPSEWANENGSVMRPRVSWTHRTARMAMSITELVSRMRASNSRRWSSIVSPTKQAAPAMPPAATAISCFCWTVMTSV